MTRDASIDISVIVPAFNEEASLPGVIARLDDVLETLPGRHEILIVDDGSRDRTPEVCKTLAARYPRVRVFPHARNRGYGAAQRTGCEAARGTYIWIIPGDGQIPPAALLTYIEAMQAGIDVVVGRYPLRPDTFTRRVLSKAYVGALRMSFGLPLESVNAPKLYRRDLLSRVRMTADGGGADAEILVQAWLIGACLSVVEVECLPRGSGRSSVTWRTALSSLAELAVVSARVARRLGLRRRKAPPCDPADHRSGPEHHHRV